MQFRNSAIWMQAMQANYISFDSLLPGDYSDAMISIIHCKHNAL